MPNLPRCGVSFNLNDPATDSTVVSQKPDLNEAAGAADAFTCCVPAVDAMI